jgi:hypothetical protein
MSLINEALKRAKQAQQEAPSPTAGTLQFRPVEPSRQGWHGLGMMLPVVLAVSVLPTLLLLWQATKSRNAAQRPQPAQAALGRPKAGQAAPRSVLAAPPASPAPAAVTPDPAPAPAAFAPGPPPAAPVQAESIATTPRKAAGPASVPPDPAPAIAALAPVTPPPASVGPESIVTPPPAVAEPAPVKPPPLRLQGIVFDPSRPSAVINGQSVFVGERVGDFTVLAISQRSATLAGGGITNVLALGR